MYDCIDTYMLMLAGMHPYIQAILHMFVSSHAACMHIYIYIYIYMHIYVYIYIYIVKRGTRHVS